jgi:N-methylhydantoinase A
MGVDVGGTFTDLVAISANGAIRTTKVLSIADDRARGVVAAVEASGIAGGDVAFIAHGTTVVTNLLLERAGARVVACITSGFTDLLELRRQERAALYDLTKQHPDPLVSRDDIVAVRERVVPEGITLALDDAAIADVVRAVLDRAPDTVAITLLHAYAEPAHERALQAALRAALDAAGQRCDVICSYDVLPEIREYERLATTVAEAYARPAVRRYLGDLRARLTERALPAPRVMTSAGGTLSADDAALHAASLALSGPAGGVTGAAAIARALGIAAALTIDIGGTSADVGLIDDGEPLVERGGTIAGVPIALPRVLVEAVAAGGGSIGWLDAGGALRAGPESAGASPGPAAYGRGGVRPTMTDAHVVLGHVAAGSWSGGVTITASLARHAMQQLADPLGVTVERASEALIQTADATMARALRRVSVERGIDPRGVALIAFGGGGPLHACGLAERLGMTRIVIPPHAGVLSAVGLALAPERREGILSLVTSTAAIDARVLASQLTNEAVRLRGADGTALSPRWWARTRFVGQGYELDVPVSPGDDGATIATRFLERHMARTGFVLDRDVECISVRTALLGDAWPVAFARPERVDGAAVPALDEDDGTAFTRTLVGPAIVRLPDATLRVMHGWTAQALPIGGWMLERT